MLLINVKTFIRDIFRYSLMHWLKSQSLQAENTLKFTWRVHFKHFFIPYSRHTCIWPRQVYKWRRWTEDTKNRDVLKLLPFERLMWWCFFYPLLCHCKFLVPSPHVWSPPEASPKPAWSTPQALDINQDGRWWSDGRPINSKVLFKKLVLSPFFNNLPFFFLFSFPSLLVWN